MKKSLVFVAIAAVALIGCKKGTVSGTVRDAFTNQPLDSSYVQILKTALSSPPTTTDGKFTIADVKPGEYTLRVGKDKHSTAKVRFTVTEEALDANVDLYIYNAPKKMKTGLYKKSDKGPEKILNHWAGFEIRCDDGIKGYRYTSLNSKSKLPEAQKQSSAIDLFFRQGAGNKHPLLVKSAPLKKEKISTYKNCQGFGKKDKYGLFVDTKAGKEITVKYLSEGLSTLNGTIEKGTQMFWAEKAGRHIMNYYFEVE